MITDELAAFLESGVSMIVGTRDAGLRPDCLRAIGACVEPGGRELTIFLPVAVAGDSIANLLDNGRIATTFARICDHRTFQLKGRVVHIEAAAPECRDRVERYRRALAEELEKVGLPQHAVFRINPWPCHAVRLAVESIFDQTPGPSAGKTVEVSRSPRARVELDASGMLAAPSGLRSISLAELDYACFQGLLPALIGTCDREGEPNITYLSQVDRLDAEQVALSCQFFNKTKRNLLENPFSAVMLYHPLSFEACRLQLELLREEREGPLFDAMEARIDVIASHTGMSGVFKLLSADVHRVHRVERVEGFLLPASGQPISGPPLPPGERLTELRGLQAISARIAAATDLDGLLTLSLEALDQLLGLEHSLLLVADGPEARELVVVASRGYCPTVFGEAGLEAEVSFGSGVIGTAAERRRMVRVSGIGGGLSYGRAIREQVAAEGRGPLLPEIELPGLPDAQAQLALPMLVGARLVGVLAAESRDPLAFDEWDEAFLQIVANQIASRFEQLAGQQVVERVEAEPAVAERATVVATGATRRLVFYRNDDCIFADGEYLIRNVPARILWRLLGRWEESGQSEFSNRELRLDPSLGLPRYRDNLESRLILLRKRLEARCPEIRLVPVRRGRFALEVSCPLELSERDSF